MLNQTGFSLLEMLFALALSSLIIIGVITFYPQFQLDIVKIYQQNRLEETVDQALTRLIKDIRRAGFIANDPQSITQNSLELKAKNDCITIRYDSNSTGKWRSDASEPQLSDVFTYRYYKNNLEYQTNTVKCTGFGWEKLLDANEVKVTLFQIKQHSNYIELQFAASLKTDTTVSYHTTQYIKNENR